MSAEATAKKTSRVPYPPTAAPVMVRSSALWSSTPLPAAVSCIELNIIVIVAPRKADNRVPTKRPGRWSTERKASSNMIQAPIGIPSPRSADVLPTVSPRCASRSATASTVGSFMRPTSRPSARKSTESA
ncbi:hypothetical protein GA0115255_104982 [Streptomyces sp. Ncost-T6T-2b]|nr:hypothetical protein GA0115255_104982 [Streptomyces sp. Ncost-T6T-2b]